jgi:hypothetical protein
LTRGRQLRRLHRIEEFGAGEEHHAGAQQRQQYPHIARIDFQIVAAAFYRAHGKGVDHQPNLGPRLDREQPGDSHAHGHRLIKPRANRAVPPVPD